MNNSTNNSKEEVLSCPFPSLTVLQQSLRAGSVLLVIILSLLGNIFVLYVVRSNLKLHTVTHFLIVNLAGADLVITVVNMSVLFKIQVTGNDEAFSGVAGHVYCVGLIVVLNLSIACSILTLTAIAIERFCSVMFPFKRIITLKVAKAMMAGIWITSFAITIPFFFHIRVEDYYGDGVFYCVEDWSPLDTVAASKVFQIVFFVSLYACPLTLIFVLYLSIGVKLWRRQAKTEVSSLGNSHRRMRMTVRVTKMLIASVVAFTLCWLPQHVTLFINYFMLHICPPEYMWFGGTLLAYANSAMNPIIYVAFHPDYRKQLKVILARCFPICVGLCNTRIGNGLNLNSGKKAEKSEEFDMINVLSFKPISVAGFTEASVANSLSLGINREQNSTFCCMDETSKQDRSTWPVPGSNAKPHMRRTKLSKLSS